MKVTLGELAKLRPLRDRETRIRGTVIVPEPQWGFSADGWSELRVRTTDKMNLRREWIQ